MTIIHQFTRRKIAFAKKLLHLDFLKDCKILQVTPKFLQIKNQMKLHPTYGNIVKNAEFKLLQKCIRTLRKTIAREEMLLYYMHLEISANQPAAHFDNIMCNIQCKIEQATGITKQNHKEKLDKLTRSTHKNTQYKSTDMDNFLNLTDYVPSYSEKRILNQGPKFNPQTKLEIEKTITSFEKCLQNIPETIRDSLRGYIVWNCLKIKRKEDLEKIDMNYNRLISQLRNKDNLRILTADKAQAFVLIKEDDFQTKIRDILNELQVMRIDVDPTNKLIEQVNKLAKEYPDRKTIIAKFPMYTTVPPLFVKIKTHKEHMPLRPIVNRRVSPVYPLEKHLNSLLKPLIEGSEHVLHSSLQLIESLKELKLNPTAKFYSLDVKSLYPSIPTEQVKKIIIQKCKDNMELHKHLDFIVKSLNIICNANYFKINNEIYKQNTGAPMGSCLAPLMGEITMQYIEETVLYNNILTPFFYRRYVDDVFIIWDYTDEKLQEFVIKMNNIFDTINLTIEKEKDRTLPFLDILIHRNDNNTILWTEVYRKPTSPLSIVSAKSYTSQQYIFNAIAPLIRRSITHSTFQISVKKELNLIKNKMIKEGHKESTFYRIKANVLKSIVNKNLKPTSKHLYIGSIPFNNGFFNIVKQFKILGYKVAFKPAKLKNLIVKDRDNSPPVGGVYNIPLKYNGKEYCYIGKTKRNLKTRLKEHQYSLRSIYGNTALKQFAITKKDVEILWDKAKIIAAPTDLTELDIREKAEIWKRGDKCINLQQGADLARLWQPLISNKKTERIQREEEPDEAPE